MKKAAPKRPKRLHSTSLSRYAAALAVLLCCVFVGVALFRPRPVSSNPIPVKLVNEQDTILLPTPSRAVAKGEKLGAVPFLKTRWPKQSAGAGYMQDELQFASAVALTPLPANLPVPVSAVSADAVDSNAVVEGIPAGYRAITVRVDAESAVEGWARSGNYVDVIVLRQSSDRELGVEAKVIAENVKILSAGRSTEPLSGQSAAPNAPPTITLLVSQEDALKIKTGASVGKLAFSLRGTGDQGPTVSVEMNQKSLLGAAKTFVARKERFNGMAKGPDGRTYLLGEDARWRRAPKLEQGGGGQAAAAGNSRAQLGEPAKEQAAASGATAQ